MPATPSIARIETFQIAARQITDATALPAGLADRINAVVAEVNALRVTGVKIEDHQPVFLDKALYPGHMQQIGCACGHKPKTANRRGSTMFSSYNTHLTRIGLPRPRYNPSPRYTSGPFAGMDFNERMAAERAAAQPATA